MRLFPVLLLCTAALAACGGPARPPAPAVFPFAVDTQRTAWVRPGIAHRFIYAAGGPWAINVIEVDRAACYSAVALKGFATATGRRRTSQILAEADSNGQVVAGVNADFFRPDGTPTNAHVSGGRLLTAPIPRPVIAFDSAGAPRILNLMSQVRLVVDSSGALRAIDSAGSVAILPTPSRPRTAARVMEAVGGRPILVRDGLVVPGLDSAGGAGFAAARHPRTAVGIADGGRRLILVTVDGRQKPYSDGMTLTELAGLMRALGARDALNLDGGGSTAMVVKTARGDSLVVVNKPSDPTGERAVGNALAVVRGC